MSRTDVLVDAAEAVRVAVVAMRRAETYYDWQMGGTKHSCLKALRTQLESIHCMTIEAANFPEEKLSDEHNVRF